MYFGYLSPAVECAEIRYRALTQKVFVLFEPIDTVALSGIVAYQLVYAHLRAVVIFLGELYQPAGVVVVRVADYPRRHNYIFRIGCLLFQHVHYAVRKCVVCHSAVDNDEPTVKPQDIAHKPAVYGNSAEIVVLHERSADLGEQRRAYFFTADVGRGIAHILRRLDDNAEGRIERRVI